MNVGSIVTMRNIRDRRDDEKGKLIREASYKAAPPGSMFVLLLLGHVNKGEQFDRAKYEEALKNLGLMEIPEEPK